MARSVKCSLCNQVYDAETRHRCSGTQKTAKELARRSIDMAKIVLHEGGMITMIGLIGIFRLGFMRFFQSTHLRHCVTSAETLKIIGFSRLFILL